MGADKRLSLDFLTMGVVVGTIDDKMFEVAGPRWTTRNACAGGSEGQDHCMSASACANTRWIFSSCADIPIIKVALVVAKATN